MDTAYGKLNTVGQLKPPFVVSATAPGCPPPRPPDTKHSEVDGHVTPERAPSGALCVDQPVELAVAIRPPNPTRGSPTAVQVDAGETRNTKEDGRARREQGETSAACDKGAGSVEKNALCDARAPA